nr:zinc-binding dehydrogenase [Flexivirga oryzae]
MGTFPSAFAEYLVSDHRFVLPREGLAPEIACALPTALLTEFGALRAAAFEPGHTVLVTGASTGIGMIGVQVAKALDAARIIATTRTAAKKDLILGLGADVLPAVARGDIAPVIDSTMDVADCARAADRLRSGQAIGKIVLVFG